MASSKPGPRPFKPTATQRRRVMRGIAAGLTMQQLADDLDVSIRTVRRAFASEIKRARTTLILDNLDRLHEAADSGNVSAMKALAASYAAWRPDLDEDEEVDEDDIAWEDTGPNLARNPEIQNGKTVS